MSEFDKVLEARSKTRPVATDYINAIFTDFTELHGDRRFGDDASIVGGIAMLGEIPVTVIGIDKGRDVEDKIKHNFGSPHPEGYRKALRLMKQAEKFRRPVVCFIDTAGAACDIEAEQRGQGLAIAENLYEMMTLKTPIVSIVIGEGGSGGALALAVADEVWMLENAYYSVVSPEACASILWKDSAEAPRAAESLKLGAENLKSLDIIEEIISECDNFEMTADAPAVMAHIKDMLSEKVSELSAQSNEELMAKRYEKYRKIGRYK